MTPTPLSGACWCDGEMLLRLSGPGSVVEAAASRLDGELLEDSEIFWRGLREQNMPFFTATEDLRQFSVRSNSPHCKEQDDWFIDWGGSRRWLTGQHDDDELEAIAIKSGGEVSRIKGGDRNAEVLPSLDVTKRDLLVRLKRAFDPAGVFNPGRLYSWM